MCKNTYIHKNDNKTTTKKDKGESKKWQQNQEI